jgi:predicted RND superfamily exporter protein
MPDNIDDDISPLREGAIQLHELYEEFKNAGFSRKEAMELTVRMIGQALGQAMNPDNG